MKQRKLAEIRRDIAFHRQWIRRLEDDGSDPEGLAKAKERLAELEVEKLHVKGGREDRQPGSDAA
jgi:hypothetical protein